MKSLKLSFALIVAVLAVGVTVATKANFGKRVVTACFTQLTLRNAAGTIGSQFVADALQTPRQSCASVIAQVSAATPVSYIHAGVAGTALPDELNCLGTSPNFCCANVTVLLASDPGFAATPAIDLGDGVARKYKIASSADVFCKSN